MTTDELVADYAHTCTVLEQVLGGLVTALDGLQAAGLLAVPPTLDLGDWLDPALPVEWHVWAYQLREARELVGRQQEGA